MSTLPPPKGDVDGWDKTRPWNQQTASNIPLIFKDAMSVREEVFGEQGVPLDAEFDEDDARSWHWVVYASVGTSPASPPKSMLARSDSGNTPADDARRASATAQRLPVGTIRLIPPPHGPNKYLDDKHPDADPPKDDVEHTKEPYVKLGRLAVLAPYRKLNLSKLLINSVFDFATQQPDAIYLPPSPTTREMAALQGPNAARPLAWQGLVMIHAQAHLKHMWGKHGFREELRNDAGEVEIAAEPRWMEEGIEHVGMWKRLRIAQGRL
jgi:predicted GNAT family N-acyltransferase